MAREAEVVVVRDVPVQVLAQARAAGRSARARLAPPRWAWAETLPAARPACAMPPHGVQAGRSGQAAPSRWGCTPRARTPHPACSMDRGAWAWGTYCMCRCWECKENTAGRACGQTCMHMHVPTHDCLRRHGCAAPPTPLPLHPLTLPTCHSLRAARPSSSRSQGTAPHPPPAPPQPPRPSPNECGPPGAGLPQGAHHLHPPPPPLHPLPVPVPEPALIRECARASEAVCCSATAPVPLRPSAAAAAEADAGLLLPRDECVQAEERHAHWGQ